MIVVLPNLVSGPDRVRHHAPDVFGSDIVSYATTFTDRDAGMPQVILVEIPEPASVLRAHYHASDQFQLVIEGDGRLGHHDLTPVSLHYTNRYTGYGPIISGPRGLSYYVLRPSFDPLGLGQYLHHPELREKAKRYPGRKRSFMKNAIALASPDALRERDVATSARLFGVDDDAPDAGTFADLVSLAPGAEYTAPDPATGGGQVLFVLAGGACYGNRTLAPPSAIALTREERAITVAAGDEGLQALVMQYPRWH
jgi:hypothetical protein